MDALALAVSSTWRAKSRYDPIQKHQDYKQQHASLLVEPVQGDQHEGFRVCFWNALVSLSSAL